jgi:hypothetical protein
VLPTHLPDRIVNVIGGSYTHVHTLPHPKWRGSVQRKAGRVVTLCGAQGEAIYAGPLLEISWCTINKQKNRTRKAVTCKFNITGAKLYIYWRVYSYLCSWIAMKYFTHRNDDERGQGRPSRSPHPKDGHIGKVSDTCSPLALVAIYAYSYPVDLRQRRSFERCAIYECNSPCLREVLSGVQIEFRCLEVVHE